MNIKKTITATAVAIVAVTLTAAPEVTDVVAKQRYPWNGLVDITCKVTGINGTANEFAVAVVNRNSGDVRRVDNFWVIQGGTNSTDRELHTNGDHWLLWDAKADLGTGLHSNIVVRVSTVVVPGHSKVQLWKGGPYWAHVNIGAEEPYQGGYHFWWGDTVGYWMPSPGLWQASDGSTSFSSETPSPYEYDLYRVKITEDGVLASAYDAAHVHWGGKWRMPTTHELRHLNLMCDWTWTTLNGRIGYEVRGRGECASASIFLPLVGNATSTGGVVTNGYWSSSVVPPNSANTAWNLYFDSSGHDMYENRRFSLQPVRPVQGVTE